MEERRGGNLYALERKDIFVGSRRKTDKVDFFTKYSSPSL
jgi:hypothetical protein